MNELSGNRGDRRENGGASGRGELGQTLMEFALAVPILLIVVFGIFEYALILDDQLQLRNAARDAGRAGAIHFCSTTTPPPSPCTEPSPIPDADRVTVATNAADAPGETSLVSCPLQAPSVTSQGSANPPIITVTLSCSYTPVTPVAPLVLLLHTTLHLSMTLSSTTVRYIEP
jgi:hypothetical protein